ncbi:Single-stranded DNA-binding protein [Gracilaria domingensis]|nr:Single-stranded DNA-binding protein [Gracilaria domingensis]
MDLGNRLEQDLSEGSSAFVLFPFRYGHGLRASMFVGQRCRNPFNQLGVLHVKRKQRPFALGINCQNLGYEEDDGVQIEEYLDSQWDFEIADDELVEVEESNPSLPNLNVVTLVGRLGADPVFKVTSSGSELCKFSMAVSHDYDPNDSDEDKTSWFDIEVWGSLAKLAARARKGVRVGVSGSLGLNCWTGRDGLEREDPIVRATTFEILQSRSEQTPYSKDYTGSDGGKLPETRPTDNSYLNLSGNLRDLPF